MWEIERNSIFCTSFDNIQEMHQKKDFHYRNMKNNFMLNTSNEWLNIPISPSYIEKVLLIFYKCNNIFHILNSQVKYKHTKNQYKLYLIFSPCTFLYKTKMLFQSQIDSKLACDIYVNVWQRFRPCLGLKWKWLDSYQTWYVEWNKS